MDEIKYKFESGQSLVLLALLMIGLIAMLALVLDGGNTFTKRRQAQNAADAGALAGARNLCYYYGTTKADQAAREYVKLNGANVFDLFITEDTVDVTSSITYTTFFASLIGRPEMEARAEASATCGNPCVASVLPVAWSCSPPAQADATDDGFDCDDLYTNPDFSYIFMDSEDLATDFLCAEPDGTPGPMGGTMDCDIDDDGENDLDVLSSGGRSWLSFSENQSVPELESYIEGGGVPSVESYRWYPAVMGNKTSLYKAVVDANLVGQKVYIPVFDTWCEDNPSSDASECNQPTGDDNLSHYQEYSEEYANGNHVDPQGDEVIDPADTPHFHVIAFAAFEIDCVLAPQQTGNCDGFDYLADNNLLDQDEISSAKIIEGHFVEMVSSADLLAGDCPDFNVGLDVIYLNR